MMATIGRRRLTAAGLLNRRPGASRQRHSLALRRDGRRVMRKLVVVATQAAGGCAHDPAWTSLEVG